MEDNLNFTTVLLGAIPICVFLFWLIRKKTYYLPPGPFSVPPIGHVPFLGKEPYKVYKQLSEKYGDIFGLYLGSSYAVILNEFSLAKEALNNPALLDRPSGLFDFIPDGGGIAGFNGAEWIEQRRYAMKTLKDAGMSKIPWESDVQAEIDDFLKILESYNCQPVDLLTPQISASISNNMTSIIMGKRLLVGDARRTVVDDAVNAVTQVFALSGITTYLQFLMPILVKFGISKYGREYYKLVSFNDLIRGEVNTRKSLPSEQREDIFIDEYFNEIDKSDEKNTQTFFNERNLIGNVQTLIVGGSETSRTAVLWLLLAMASYPEVQRKIHDEIDSVLGREGKILWMERSRLPYTYATVLEGQRWRTVAPINVPRRASEETRLSSYDIPRNTVVLVNLWGLHNDQRYWKHPDSFDPSRFLQNDGTPLIFKPDSYMPFSIGRRSCPGEFVALMEIFQYITSILQRFEIKPLKEKKPLLDGVLEGATYQPPQQKLRFVLRN